MRLLKTNSFHFIQGKLRVHYVFQGDTSGKESACQCRRCKGHKFDPWVGKISWRKKNGNPLPGRLQSKGSQKELDKLILNNVRCLPLPYGTLAPAVIAFIFSTPLLSLSSIVRISNAFRSTYGMSASTVLEGSWNSAQWFPSRKKRESSQWTSISSFVTPHQRSFSPGYGSWSPPPLPLYALPSIFLFLLF